MSGAVFEDFVDIARCLREEQCAFVIVGAHALAAHGVARATGDIDIFVRPDPDNAERLMRALQRFGAPVAAHGVSARDFVVPGTVYQLGLPPRRIDLLTQISGVTFEEAVQDQVVGSLGGERVPCIGFESLLKNKRATGRTKDVADAEALEELRARRAR